MDSYLKRSMRRISNKTNCRLILGHYIAYLCEMSEQELPEIIIGETFNWRMWNKWSMKEISAICGKELKKYVFVVPRLKELPQECQHGINRYRPVKEFISFLVRFLYRKDDSCGDHEIGNLEKELRFLLTVLGDTPLMACADHEHTELENLLEEFEAVADEAGSVVHSLFFHTDQAVGEKNEAIGVVLKDMGIFKDDMIMKLLDVVPACVSRSTDMSPKTSVLDSLLALDSLVRDLEDLMNNRDDDRIVDVKDQIQTLHQGMICLQSFIKGTSSSPQPSENTELRECCMRIGDLARGAEYIIVSFLAGDAPSWYLVNRLIHVNHKIEQYKIKLPEIIRKYSSGGLKVVKHLDKQVSMPLSNRVTEVDEDIVGSEDKMTYILDHLVGGGTELRVISIFGMPGLGKTTLAKKLYSHPSVNCRFDRLSWCVVSQTYLKRNVLASIVINIASEIGKDEILKMEEEGLAERIHKTLKGRRYLIVMDDIWDPNVCDELFRCFPDDGNASRILFTTRNKEVVPHDCIMYALPSLSDGQCWELIKKKVFNNQPCPPELVKSGRELAAKCRGLPLAAVVVAGILLNKDKEEGAWEEVLRNLSSYILDDGNNPVMQILKLSYDHLPQHLKLCFLYLGVFLEDQEIPARHMVNMWIAQGFIHNENEKDAAEGYLIELIDKSLVMVSKKRLDGGPKTCLLHDLLRELCLKTCEEEKLTRFVNEKYLKYEEHRPKVGMYSTTWMYQRSSPFGQRRTSNYQIEVPEMRQLRVLYLDYSFIYLTGIEYLVCLKYLVVDKLPPSIANLVNLEYLCTLHKYTVYLSSTIMQMKKLKYVNARYRARYGEDSNTSLTNKLEFLSNISIRNGRDEKMLKCSPHLHRLKCTYKKRGYGRIDLSFLTRLESLTLIFFKSLIRGVTMSLPSSIKKLTLAGYNTELGPQTMSTIGRLKNIEILKLEHIKFEGKEWDTRDGEFEKLRYLRLVYTDLKRWNVGSSEHLPKLQQLMLHSCPKLEEIPAEIGEIPTMQIIEVDRFLEGSARRIQEEQRDVGNEDLKVIHLNDYNSFYEVDVDSIMSVYETDV